VLLGRLGCGEESVGCFPGGKAAACRLKIGAGCAWRSILLNGKKDLRTSFRIPLEAHLKKKLLHVLVLIAVACPQEDNPAEGEYDDGETGDAPASKELISALIRGAIHGELTGSGDEEPNESAKNFF